MSLSFPVSVEKNAALQRRMVELEILESQFEETFIRSSGKGGQNVNKVSTAVFLLHLPTALSVKCSVYRTQGLNRYKARALICDLIADFKFGEGGSKKEAIRRKIIKQKKNKTRKSKRKI